MDLTGITNVNEYYTNHYFSAIFSGNAEETIKNWAEKAKTQDERKAREDQKDHAAKAC